MSGIIRNRDPGSGPSGLAELFRQATTFHQQGKLDAAARCYSAIVSADSQYFDGLHMFGVLRAQQGKFDDAVGLLRQAIARNPASGPAHNNLGMTLNLMERHDEAIAPLDRAIELSPQDPLARNNLDNALQALGRHREAATLFDRAVALKPDYVEALSNLGAALHSLGRSEQAIPVLERALALNPGFTQGHINLGVVLHALDRREEAMACFDRVLALDPRNILAHEQIAGIHLEMGCFAAARGCYERALEIAPRNTRILYDIVQCGKVSADDRHLTALKSVAADGPALPDEQRILLQFALFKAYADLGQDELAFRHLRDGNTLKRRRIAYDEAADLDLFNRISAVFSPELIRSRARLGNPSEQPIFIVGMMRSGSTLVEQILASHPDAFAAGERPDFNEAYKTVRQTLELPETYPETVPLLSDEQIHQVGDEYISRIERLAAGRPALRIIDKMPGNFSAIGLIRLALPNARIIHTVRDPVDTCLSCFSKLFSDNQPFTYDLGELGRYYRAYAQLMEHWRRVLPEEAFLDVQYEELVGDFGNQVRRILDYCGLTWNAACLSFYETSRPVRTASQMQVRQPIYRSSIGRWRPDQSVLRPLLDGLGNDIEVIARGGHAGIGES